MRRSRLTITLNQNTLDQIDGFVDNRRIRNRSHAIEYIIGQYLKPTVKKALILAGGQGTKLRPYTYEVPTALLPIKGKPIIEYMINQLKECGVEEVIVAISHLGEKIKETLGDGDRFGLKIKYSEEKKPLLTGGAVLKARKLLGDTSFLVLHGDILTDMPFSDFILFHKKENIIGTIALTTVNHPSRFGQLKLQGTKLTRFYQKNKDSEVQSYLVNTGIYIFESSIFDYFPKEKTSFQLETVIEEMIKRKKINGYVFEGQWFAVGSPQNYELAIKYFNNR